MFKSYFFWNFNSVINFRRVTQFLAVPAWNTSALGKSLIRHTSTVFDKIHIPRVFIEWQTGYSLLRHTLVRSFIRHTLGQSGIRQTLGQSIFRHTLWQSLVRHIIGQSFHRHTLTVFDKTHILTVFLKTHNGHSLMRHIFGQSLIRHKLKYSECLLLDTHSDSQ